MDRHLDYVKLNINCHIIRCNLIRAIRVLARDNLVRYRGIRNRIKREGRWANRREKRNAANMADRQAMNKGNLTVKIKWEEST